jgi:ATP-binding cassette subfamily B protein
MAALGLAATNQIFSLMDPYIFRKIIDDVAAIYRADTHTMSQFVDAIWPLALASVGVAFVSRVAKNFQDYMINTVTQKVGANLYSDGIRHSLELPYETFEDQRSGETLGKLQKVRTDVEKLITLGINILFQSVIALVFISIYAFSVHWMVMPLFLVTGPLIAWVSSVLSKKIKVIQIEIVKESTGLAGSTTESLRNIELVKSLGLAEQEIAHLNATTEKILKLELKKVRYVPFTDLPYYGVRYFWTRVYRLFSREKRLAFWGPAFEGMDAVLKAHTLNEVCALQWQQCVNKAEAGLAGRTGKALGPLAARGRHARAGVCMYVYI